MVEVVEEYEDEDEDDEDKARGRAGGIGDSTSLSDMYASERSK